VIEFEGQITGEVRLDNVDANDRRVSLAILNYHRRWWDQGLGTESMRLVLTNAFDELGLHRVSLRVLAFNYRAIALYQKLEFVEEGRERQSALIDGEWHDGVIMSVLEDEWRSLRS
jgi:RimJ/RimL family protein N-acetyltransferase